MTLMLVGHVRLFVLVMLVRHARFFVFGIQMLLSVDAPHELDCVLMSLISLMHMYDFKFALD